MAQLFDKTPMTDTTYSSRVRAPNEHRTRLTTTASATTPAAYDDSTLNPDSGRVVADRTANTEAPQTAPVENSPRFVSRGKPFQISTMNTRTLNPISRMHELVHAASLHANDIICIQEHRQHHQSLLSSQYIDKYQLITASANKNTVNASVGGVGFLISPKAQKSLLSVEKVNSRIILLHLNGVPRLTVISVYAPTNCSEDSAKSSFYYTLNHTVSSIPPHNLLAVCGDFNAKLGPDLALHTLHPVTNNNGDLLHDFAQQHRLVICNTKYQKPEKKLWTYEDPKWPN